MSYFIGLLMVADEDDIIDRTLEINREIVDAFYVLDGAYVDDEGTVVDDRVLSLVKDDPKCWGYVTDDMLDPDVYGDKPVDGWRQILLDQAIQDHGPHNWFLLLHGDEVWLTDPRHAVSGHHDGYIFELPFFFPRAGEEWQDDVHPLDQLHWQLGPGYPEVRMFRGGPGVAYNPRQHFNVTPQGIGRIGNMFSPILHYPYRSPEVQRERAARHEETQFDPDNYRHILDEDAVYWTDEMIDRQRAKPWFSELRSSAVGASC